MPDSVVDGVVAARMAVEATALCAYDLVTYCKGSARSCARARQIHFDDACVR
jgi:hypothetical protein